MCHMQANAMHIWIEIKQNKTKNSLSNTHAHRACHSSRSSNEIHARACTMNIRKSIRNARKYGINVYALHYRTAYAETHTHHTLVDGGLANALSRRNRAMRMCVRARCIRTVHNSTRIKIRWMLCTLELNVLCQEHNKKTHAQMRAYIKWGLPVPVPNACVSV